MNGVYFVNLFGFEFTVYFSKHALLRCHQRKVFPSIVIEALEAAEEKIGNKVKDNQNMIIHDIYNKISLVAQFHCRFESSIDILTVLDKADMIARKGDIEIWVRPDTQ